MNQEWTPGEHHNHQKNKQNGNVTARNRCYTCTCVCVNLHCSPQTSFQSVGIEVWATESMTLTVDCLFRLLLSLVSLLPDWETELILVHLISCSLPTKTKTPLPKAPSPSSSVFILMKMHAKSSSCFLTK